MMGKALRKWVGWVKSGIAGRSDDFVFIRAGKWPLILTSTCKWSKKTPCQSPREKLTVSFSVAEHP